QDAVRRTRTHARPILSRVPAPWLVEPELPSTRRPRSHARGPRHGGHRLPIPYRPGRVVRGIHHAFRPRSTETAAIKDRRADESHGARLRESTSRLTRDRRHKSGATHYRVRYRTPDHPPTQKRGFKTKRD